MRKLGASPAPVQEESPGTRPRCEEGWREFTFPGEARDQTRLSHPLAEA